MRCGLLLQTFSDAAVTFIKKFFGEVVAKSKEIATGAKDMVVAILKAMADTFVTLTNEVAHVLISFLDALSVAVDNNSGPIGKSARHLVSAIVDGIATSFGLQEMAGELRNRN